MKRFFCVALAGALALTACGGGPSGTPTYYDATGRWNFIIASPGALPAFDLTGFQVTKVYADNTFESSQGYDSHGNAMTNNQAMLYAKGNTKTGEITLQGNISGNGNSISATIYTCTGSFNITNNTYQGTCNKPAGGTSAITISMIRMPTP